MDNDYFTAAPEPTPLPAGRTEPYDRQAEAEWANTPADPAPFRS